MSNALLTKSNGSTDILPTSAFEGNGIVFSPDRRHAVILWGATTLNSRNDNEPHRVSLDVYWIQDQSEKLIFNEKFRKVVDG